MAPAPEEPGFYSPASSSTATGDAVSNRILSREGVALAKADALRNFDLRALVPERRGARSAITRRYRLNREAVGTGGYGTVYIAEDREITGRRVAVKQILATGAGKRRAFDNEVALMKKLDHPNIIRILETYVNGRLLCIVMELCEGGDVFERISAQGKLEERMCADIIRQVASALKYAHGRCIAHRDIKPENVCFCSDDVTESYVKVIDWGAGFCFADATMRTAVGSVAYAPPEMREATASYTAACDLWSLGVMTYVALSGMPPFWGSAEQQIKRMLAEHFPLSGGGWQAVSDDAKDFITGLLRARPESRLSIDEVLAHPWLRLQQEPVGALVTRQVLSDVHEFSRSSQFRSVFAAAVAQRVDHHSLRALQQVFCDLDTNGDGVLGLGELRLGFEAVFGASSEQVKDLEAVFTRLDLDGSGAIDYIEFCAAGIGTHMNAKEDTLWAAFKDFDLNDNIKRELAKASGEASSESSIATAPGGSTEGGSSIASDESLGFEEWLGLMRDSSRTRTTRASLSAEGGRAPGCSTSFFGRACGLLSRRPRRDGTSEVMLTPMPAPQVPVALGFAAQGFACRAVLMG